MRLRAARAAFVTALVAVVTAGCGGGGGTPRASGPPGPLSEPGPATTASELIQLADPASTTVSFIDPDGSRRGTADLPFAPATALRIGRSTVVYLSANAGQIAAVSSADRSVHAATLPGPGYSVSPSRTDAGYAADPRYVALTPSNSVGGVLLDTETGRTVSLGAGFAHQTVFDANDSPDSRFVQIEASSGNYVWSPARPADFARMPARVVVHGFTSDDQLVMVDISASRNNDKPYRQPVLEYDAAAGALHTVTTIVAAFVTPDVDGSLLYIASGDELLQFSGGRRYVVARAGETLLQADPVGDGRHVYLAVSGSSYIGAALLDLTDGKVTDLPQLRGYVANEPHGVRFVLAEPDNGSQTVSTLIGVDAVSGKVTRLAVPATTENGGFDPVLTSADSRVVVWLNASSALVLDLSTGLVRPVPSGTAPDASGQLLVQPGPDHRMRITTVGGQLEAALAGRLATWTS